MLRISETCTDGHARFRWFKWLVHFNVVYTIGIFISFTFIATFMCIPVSNYWIVGAPANTCMNEAVATLVCGIINCVADLLTTVTPIPLVMSVGCFFLPWPYKRC